MLSDTQIDMTLETKSADPDEVLTAPRPRRTLRRYRPRRTIGDRLRDALLVMAGGKASLLTHEEKPWASITFSGTRHELMLDFDGQDACDAAEDFIAALPDHEFTIPGQLVADASVREVDHSFAPEPRIVVTIALLLLEES